MTRRIALLVTVPFLLVAPLPAQTDYDRIDSLVSARRDVLGLPGVALVIVHPLTELHVRTFGEGITPDTPFLIGSVSKPITATLVHQLVDRGEIDLDSPVQRYLPRFTLADPAHAATVTVRHLLAHRSGIPRRAGLRDVGGSTTLEEAVADLASESPHAPAGKRFEYSNANYHLLGLLLEEVSGMRYPALLASRVFAPLRLEHSHTTLAAAEADGLATAHRFWFGIRQPATPAFNPELLPAGNIAMSARDLGTFVRAHLNLGSLGPVELLSTAGVIEMTTFDSGARYASGWGWRTIEGHNAIGHSGALDTYQAEVVMLTSESTGVILLTNATGMLHLPAVRQVAMDVARMIAGLEPLPTKRPGPLAVWWIIGVGAILIAGLWVRDLVRLGAWRRALEIERARGVRWPTRAIGGAALDAATLVAVPIGIAHFTGLSLSSLLVIQADVGWFVVVGLAVSAVKLMYRSYALVVKA